jgi:hypothetical protein
MQFCQPQGHHSRGVRKPLCISLLGQIAISGAGKLFASGTTVTRQELRDFVSAVGDHAV